MEHKGKLISIGFNVRYLIDVLQVLGSEGMVQIELKDKLSPSLVKKGGIEIYLRSDADGLHVALQRPIGTKMRSKTIFHAGSFYRTRVYSDAPISGESRFCKPKTARCFLSYL